MGKQDELNRTRVYPSSPIEQLELTRPAVNFVSGQRQSRELPSMSTRTEYPVMSVYVPKQSPMINYPSYYSPEGDRIKYSNLSNPQMPAFPDDYKY
jgi:hypothetical protein